MDKLRKIIEQHSDWSELTIYIDRMEAHVESDFSHALENAKALLETIGKEICEKRGQPLTCAPSVNEVLKKSFTSLGYANDALVKTVSGSLANIGQEVGNLRNEISPTSHGKSLEELRERNNKVDKMTREFLIDSTVVIAVFLIRAFDNSKENMRTGVLEREEPDNLEYHEVPEFNESWDESFGEFQMGNYAYLASEILFNVDYNAYQTEYAAFKDTTGEEIQ